MLLLLLMAATWRRMTDKSQGNAQRNIARKRNGDGGKAALGAWRARDDDWGMGIMESGKGGGQPMQMQAMLKIEAAAAALAAEHALTTLCAG
jgi:hypothetical protein